MSGPPLSGRISRPPYNPLNNIDEAIKLFTHAYPKIVKDLYDRIDHAENFRLLMDIMTEKDKMKYSMVIQKESLAFYLRHFGKFQKEQKELLNDKFGKFGENDRG